MRNVLVTGGAGFIGSNFVRYLLGAEPQVQIFNLDLLTYAGSRENLTGLPDPGRHILIEGDICNRELVEGLIRENQITTIIHFAAETHVDRSILDPEPFIHTNLVGTYVMLEAARRAWMVDKINGPEPVRFHHISTDEVFGSLAPGESAFSESTAYSPNSPYAASKASSDHLVRAYHHTYELPVSITNCSNNYGPYQFPEKLIPLTLLNAVAGLPLPIYGDGQQIRDWLFVEDHCEAIWRVILDGEPGETYIVGGNNQPTNLSVVQELCEILDELRPASPYAPHRSLIRFVADRPGHDRRYAMDITKISRELGWQPHQSLKMGLLKTAKWYLERPDWLDAIRQQRDYQGWLQMNYASRGESK